MNKSKSSETVRVESNGDRIADHFPVRFESTNFVVDDFGIGCHVCGHENGVGNIQGEFSKRADDLVVVSGECVCPACGHQERVLVRIHEDKRITALTKDGWKLFDFNRAEPRGFWARLFGLLGFARG